MKAAGGYNHIGENIHPLPLMLFIRHGSRFAMPSRKLALRRTFAWPSVKRSLLVAILVGTALNAINQGPELLDDEAPVIWKLLLTYAVPFAVASYGSYAAFRTYD